jgi:hypothetical protein
MTSARLHQAVTETLAQRRIRRATAFERERLAAVVHLCGRGRGVAFAQRGFRTLPGERCGDHDLTVYLARVRRLADTFAQLGAAS